MSTSSVSSVADVENQIRLVLSRIQLRDYVRFRCDHAILYLYDPSTHLLEPIFARPERAYVDLEPISASDDRGAFMASLAFRSEETEYSLKPFEDPRMCDDAKRLMRSYGIHGALVACPLPPRSEPDLRFADSPIGVLVLCANRELEGADPEDEVREYLNAELVRLTSLLVLRERALDRDVAGKYEKLTRDLFQNLRPIGTSEATALRLSRQLSVPLRASQFLVHVHDSERDPHGYKAANATNLVTGADLAPTVELVKRVLTLGSPLVLNRARQNENLYRHLATLSPPLDHAWMAVCVGDGRSEVTWLVGRPAQSFRDHFTVYERTFLDRAARVFHFLLKRSVDFESMCQTLTISSAKESAEPISKGQFEDVCHVFREFFDIDQVLLTKVTKGIDRYRIDGVYANGFRRERLGYSDGAQNDENDNNDWIVHETVRTLPGEMGKSAEKLDVLPHILQHYLTATSNGDLPADFSPLFPVQLDCNNTEFVVDPKVVERCRLKGSIYYLQCVSKDLDGHPTLRSILHLGNSRGDLKLPREAEGLLQTIAAKIADSAADNERLDAEKHLREIRSYVDPAPTNLQGIVSRVKEGCHSIGCTLFLRGTLLHIAGWMRPAQAEFERAFARLLMKTDEWSEILGDAHADKIRKMLRGFFGLAPENLDMLLAAPNRVHVAPLLARSLYVRVAQTEEKLSHDRDIVGLVASACDPMRSVQPFAAFLAEDCYLPGYGLTGWTLRYGCDMLLKDKNSGTLTDFFTSKDIHAPHLSAVIQMLRDLSIESNLAKAPVVAPEHADHIREQGNYSRRDDSFLACCLEPIDDPHFTSGVLRTSTSERLPTTFTGHQVELAQAAARHLSWMLRRVYTRQQQFILEHSLDEESHAYHGHKGRRFDQAVQTIRGAITPESAKLPEVQNALMQLETVGRQLARYRLYGQMVRDLSKLRDETINPTMVKEYSDRVLDLNPYRGVVRSAIVPQVLPSGEGQLLVHNLPRLCFVADEIITNSMKWSPFQPAELCVLVSDGWPLTVQVVECRKEEAAKMTSLVNLPDEELRPYGALFPPEKRGGGAQLYEKTLIETELTVLFAERPDGRRVYVVRHRPRR